MSLNISINYFLLVGLALVSVLVRFSATVFNPEEKSYEDTLCTYISLQRSW